MGASESKVADGKDVVLEDKVRGARAEVEMPDHDAVVFACHKLGRE